VDRTERLADGGVHACPESQHPRSAGLDPGQHRSAHPPGHRHHAALDRRPWRQRGRGTSQRRAHRRADRVGHRGLGQRATGRNVPRPTDHGLTAVLVRTDDEVYRIDAVWLGPPRATFPWRARYVSYGLGLMVMILFMFVQRRIGIGLDFFSVAWALVLTVFVTRLLGKRIDYERPLGQVLELFRHEVRGPRARTVVAG